MFYYDIHTHNIAQNKENTISIVNLPDEDNGMLPDIDNIYFSKGIHPAHISGFLDENAIINIREQLNNPRIVAIGECGIDHLAHNAKLDEQIRVFEQMILLSEEIQKPLIVHNVRATGEIMQLFKKYRPKQTWIIHGFRGNIQTAQQLQRLGIWLSLGPRYNDSIFTSQYLDMDKILLETDGKQGIQIKNIYREIAQNAKMDEENFTALIRQNVQKVFRTLP